MSSGANADADAIEAKVWCIYSNIRKAAGGVWGNTSPIAGYKLENWEILKTKPKKGGYMTVSVDPVKRKKVLTYRWIILVTLWLVYFFVYFDRMAPAVVMKELVSEFDLLPTQGAILAVAYFWPYMLMQIPSGILSDFIGPRLAVAIFFIIAGIGTAIFGMATSYNMCIFGRVLMGLGVAVVYIPIMKIQALWFRPREFATLTGILLTVGNSGAFIAAAPFNVFIAQMGWRNAFYIMGVASVVLAILVLVLVRNRPRDMGLPTIEEVDGIYVSEEARAADDALTFTKTLKIALTNWNFWWLAFFAFAVYGPMVLIQGAWGKTYLMDGLGFANQQAANVLTFWALGMIVGCPIWGLLSDRVLKSRKKAVIIGAFIYTFVWLGLSVNISGQSVAGMSLLFFCGGAFGGVYITNYAHVSEYLPRKVVGTAIGVFNMWYFVGALVYPWIMGKVLEAANSVKETLPDGTKVMMYKVGAGLGTGGFPPEIYHNGFWVCFGGMVLGFVVCLFTRESFGAAQGGATNTLGQKMK